MQYGLLFDVRCNCEAQHVQFFVLQGCQHNIVKKIIENKGDYLIAVKENQHKLYESIKSWFSDINIDGSKVNGRGHYPPTRYQYCTQENYGHGRTEKRTCRVISYKSLTEKIFQWEGVQSVVCIEKQEQIIRQEKQVVRTIIILLHCICKLKLYSMSLENIGG